MDTKTGKEIIIKKLKNPFKNTGLAKRLFREIDLLKQIKHQQIISFVDSYTPANEKSRFETM